MANNDDIQLDLNQDQAGQVIQNVPAGAQTTLAQLTWTNLKPRIRSRLVKSTQETQSQWNQDATSGLWIT
jgi:hypothetical protein